MWDFVLPPPVANGWLSVAKWLDRQNRYYLCQVNVVSGRDNVFTRILSVVLSVCVCTATWRHNSNDVITSPRLCIVCDVNSSNTCSYS